MEEYTNRTYREHFARERWEHFVTRYKETDLWVGVDRASYKPEMPEFCINLISGLRTDMEHYLKKDPGYATALTPHDPLCDAPAIFREMSAAARQTGIGPMSAVAGAVARYTALALQQKFGVKEVVIENGGDIYADIREDIDISVFAGASPLSEKIGLHINAGHAPLGICTSSGTVGPSLSFGKADAMMIICKDVLLADSYATAFANFVRKADDINPVLEKIGRVKEIIGAMLVKDDKMGVTGVFELKIFK